VTLGTDEKREVIAEDLEKKRPDMFILDENIKIS
jgi:hypothetical protein